VTRDPHSPLPLAPYILGSLIRVLLILVGLILFASYLELRVL
jgi:hypothetical protein